MLKSTLALKKADDLFEKSSMSFGEHLEELRRAIMKSAIWVAAGLCIGLPTASSVVNYMQTPLEAALNVYYRNQSVREIEKSAGESVPEELKDWMLDKKKVSQVIFLSQKRLSLPADTDPSIRNNPDVDGIPALNDLVAVRAWVGIKANSEALGLQEPFMIWLKAGFVVAIVIASPGIFFHLWQFVSSGLYPHERRYVYFFLPTSVVLFWAGVCLAFFVIFPLVIGFLLTFNDTMGIGASPRLTDYMSFALMLPLGFGISFQLPLVMLVIERLGILNVQTYLGQWRMAVLVIFFIAMVLTPADMWSMIGMAVPLVGLYFLGILMCIYLPKGTMMSGEGHDPR